MKKFVPLVALSLLPLFAFTACDTPGHSALAGAATGAAIGGLATGRGGGALVGAALGTGTGYLIGKQVQADRRDAYDQGYYDGHYADDRGYRDDPGPGYPMGRSTESPGNSSPARTRPTTTSTFATSRAAPKFRTRPRARSSSTRKG